MKKLAKNKKPSYGANEFQKYAKRIAKHAAYAEMPDLIGVSGEIQWEAPSNRKSGQFKDTHQKRQQWWAKKAKEIGVDTAHTRQWISRVAKTIHPFREKPCKKCGTWMSLEYRYPNKVLINRLRKLEYVNDAFDFSETEDIDELVKRMCAQFGNKALAGICGVLLGRGDPRANRIASVEQCVRLIELEAIRKESRLLSPGAMSNAPDRLDGFHSFNRCCRATADTGRTKENLRSYTTDRRVFEYWVDGDWIAADRLMALVRSRKALRSVACLNAGDGGDHPLPCNSDHIGPISLGFAHRPQFQFLCGPCNSGKNNRMALSDVVRLRQAELEGEEVASWFSTTLWSMTNHMVNTDEHAQRLSKLLRDNRHTYMALLKSLYESESYAFLIGLLHLPFADREPSFSNLGAKNHLTNFDRIVYKARSSKYAIEQKTRRVKIAFKTLAEYQAKENRNEHVVLPDTVKQGAADAVAVVKAQPRTLENFDRQLHQIFSRGFEDTDDLRSLLNGKNAVWSRPSEAHQQAKKLLTKVMDGVASELASRWEDDRYARAVDD